MTTNFKQVQAQPFSLAGGGAVAGATSVILKSLTQINGTLLTMTDFGTIGFGTLEPGNGTLEEQISFTGVTQNANGTATLTGVSSIAMVSPYTSSSGLAQTHAGSTSFVLSNTAGFYDQFVSKNDDATLTGKLTYPGGGNANAPVSGTVYAAPTADLEFASKKYVDTVAVSGAPNANTTTKGIVQEATQAQMDAGTTSGSTGADLFPTPALIRSKLLSDYKVDTGAANAYVITPAPAVTAYTVGQVFSFKAVNANTTASTLNVSALGVKTIKRIDGTDLLANDIKASQIVVVEYDGTNFIAISPLGNSVNFTGAGAYPAASGAAITSLSGANITTGSIPTASTTNLLYSDQDTSSIGTTSTAENTVYSFTINGGVLGTAGAVAMKILVNGINQAAGTMTIRYKYGATTMATVTVGATTGSSLQFVMDVLLFANAATNAQKLAVTIPYNAYFSNLTQSANGTAAVDSTANQTFAITIQYSSSSGSNSWGKQAIAVTKL